MYWIDQTVDPLWARFQIDRHNRTGLASYEIKCGVRRPGDAGYSRAANAAGGGQYLGKLLARPTADLIMNAWISDQLNPEADIWFFAFSSKSRTD